MIFSVCGYVETFLKNLRVRAHLNNGRSNRFPRRNYLIAYHIRSHNRLNIAAETLENS